MPKLCRPFAATGGPYPTSVRTGRTCQRSGSHPGGRRSRCSARVCAGERRRTGIEPARPGCRAAPVLKTGRGTSHLNASAAQPIGDLRARVDRVTTTQAPRLTQYAHGGGCACKIPPGELEAVVAGLVTGRPPAGPGDLLVGLDDGDDAAVVRIAAGTAVVATADFFTPVVDDAFDWGRIAAANALSDVYAMGGTPVVAVNLLAWPRDLLPMELAAEVLRGGLT